MKSIFFRIMSVTIVSVLLCYNGLKSIQQMTAVEVFADIDNKRLDMIDDYNVAAIENNIDMLLSERKKAEEELRLEQERRESYENLQKQLQDGTVSYREIFSDTMIVGDSLMHGLALYNVLDSSNMITMVSASLYHLDENVGNIINNSPDKLILHYGINMLINTDSSRKAFIDMYRQIIIELQTALPETEIYISGIFNVAQRVSSSYPGIDKYNEDLLKLCNECNVNFIDNSEILQPDSEYYGSDGIHFGKSFYVDVWLPHLFYSTLD